MTYQPQDAIAQTLSNALTSGRIAPAYLFCGPRGTGKTSSARILAKSLNCLESDQPTATPCGKCEACVSITNGSALDVIEIDAASNTGVDNIREIIERAQFAPVQCRYKVYVIDECLTGDSLVISDHGLMRLDNPEIKGKKVLSYNEQSGNWEYKKVLRWLNQGIKDTLTIKTDNQEIRCTGNHLIRTEQGWVKTSELKEGMKILSPLDGKVSQLETTFPQWFTNGQVITSIEVMGRENVYDIEVEDNHNFVANGLLVHNCHMLSTAAFNALLKTLEEPPNRVIFVLATTDPQRVLPTIISRCQRFDYRRIPLEAMVKHLGYIATQEAIDIDSAALSLVTQLSNGGMRDAESLLDQLSLLSGTITTEKVWDLVGAVSEQDLLDLLSAIATNQPETVIIQCRKLLDRGREPLMVLQNLANFYLSLLIAKSCPQKSELVTLTPQTWQKLCEAAHNWTMEAILQGQKKLKDSEVQIKNSTQPRLWLEITLLNLLPSANTVQNRIPNNTSSDHLTTTSAEEKSLPQNQTKSVPETTQSLATEDKTPQPSNTENPIAHTSPTENQNIDFTSLEDLKDKIASRITSIMTKSFVVQQCEIIELQNNTVIIGVISDFFLEFSKRHQPEIQKAFNLFFNKNINVVFKIQGDKKTAPKKEPETPRVEVKNPPPEVNQKSPAPQPSPTHTTPANSHKPLKQVAENFAKSVNGEIVLTESKPVSLPKKILNRPPLEVEDEDDLPF